MASYRGHLMFSSVLGGAYGSFGVLHLDMKWWTAFLGAVVSAGGVMIGFLSHLVLDELYSVDFMGARIKLNKFAGSAVKFWSPSWPATAVCYALLGALGMLAWKQYAPQ